MARYAGDFHENFFFAENANKIRSKRKIPFDEGSQKKEECSKNISHFRRAPKDKEGNEWKGDKERERQRVGERQCGLLSATSTGYDKVAHSLPTVTTQHPTHPTPLLWLATCFNIFGNQTSCQRLAQIMMMWPKCQTRPDHRIAA